MRVGCSFSWVVFLGYIYTCLDGFLSFIVSVQEVGCYEFDLI